MWKGIFYGKKKPVPIIHTYATITPESIKKNAKELWLLIVRDLCKTLSLEICLYHYFFVPL